MVDQIEIEKFCNRYEELYELVRLIEQPSVSAEGIERLEKKLDEALSDMSKLHDNKSSCTPLTYLLCLFDWLICRESDTSLFGITQEEIVAIRTQAEKLKIDTNEVVYFLVCAKIPYYVSRVDKSLKRSFVEAALSLYYSNWFRVFSSIEKLVEVSCWFVVLIAQVYVQAVNAQSDLSFSQNSILRIFQSKRQELPQKLFDVLSVNIDLIPKCEYQFTNAILGKGDLYVTADQAAVVTRILEGIYQSEETGKPYYFD